LLATASAAPAQQAAKMPRVGILRLGSPPDPAVEMIRKGLSELGYVEGRNILIDYRWTQGKADQLRGLAGDLVRENVDVIVAPGGTAARAAKEATSKIPIVITYVADPVGERLVSSLARPGGNITGLSNLSPDLSGKRLETLKEAFPKISRVALFVTWSEEGGQVKAAEESARLLKLKVRASEVRERGDIESGFKSIAKQGADALLIFGSGPLFEHRALLADLATRSRRPAMFPHIGFIEPGGLMSYGPEFYDIYRRTAVYVDRILKGAKPADLPVEQPTKFELVINMKTAKQIGITIPPNVLARADKVIR
jgi:putative ABC transport system substrate-binding protein